MRAKKKPAAYRKEAEWKRVTKIINDPPRTSAQRAALARLGISEERLATAPQITDLLRNADGGMKTVLAAMRFAPDEVIAAFLKMYDSIPPNDRAKLPMEAIALAADIDVRNLLGSVLLALQARSVSLVKLIAMTAHPKITAARVRFGQLPAGNRDRQALDQAMGFLPIPRGPVFVGKAVYNSGKAVMDQQRRRNDDGMLDDEDVTIGEVPIMESDLDLDRLFPPPARTQEKLIPIRNRLHAPEPKPDPARIASLFRETLKN